MEALEAGGSTDASQARKREFQCRWGVQRWRKGRVRRSGQMEREYQKRRARWECDRYG